MLGYTRDVVLGFPAFRWVGSSVPPTNAAPSGAEIPPPGAAEAHLGGGGGVGSASSFGKECALTSVPQRQAQLNKEK